MKTECDHTELADAYLKRPNYSGEAIVTHEQSSKECVGAWTPHGILAGRTSNQFSLAVHEISDCIESLGQGSIHIPYTTNLGFPIKTSIIFDV